MHCEHCDDGDMMNFFVVDYFCAVIHLLKMFCAVVIFIIFSFFFFAEQTTDEWNVYSFDERKNSKLTAPLNGSQYTLNCANNRLLSSFVLEYGANIIFWNVRRQPIDGDWIIIYVRDLWYLFESIWSPFFDQIKSLLFVCVLLLLLLPSQPVSASIFVPISFFFIILQIYSV